MKSLDRFGRRELVWSQPMLSKREFELHSGSDLVATLKWHRPFGSLATGQYADEAWTFKRAGFLRPRVTVRLPGSEIDFAQYEAGWAGGGQLLLSGGRGYYWRQRSFWHNVWAFENETGEIVTQFRADMHVLKYKVLLSIPDIGQSAPDRSLLSMLGLYLLILSDEDTTTALTSVIVS